MISSPRPRSAVTGGGSLGGTGSEAPGTPWSTILMSARSQVTDRPTSTAAPEGEPCSIAFVRASLEASSTRPALSAGHSSRSRTQAIALRTNATTVRSAGTRSAEWRPTGVIASSRRDVERCHHASHRRYTTSLEGPVPP